MNTTQGGLAEEAPADVEKRIRRRRIEECTGVRQGPQNGTSKRGMYPAAPHVRVYASCQGTCLFPSAVLHSIAPVGSV